MKLQFLHRTIADTQAKPGNSLWRKLVKTILCVAISVSIVVVLAFSVLCFLKWQRFGYENRVLQDVACLLRGKVMIGDQAIIGGTNYLEIGGDGKWYGFYLYFFTDILDAGLKEVAQQCKDDTFENHRFQIMFWLKDRPNSIRQILQPKTALRAWGDDAFYGYDYEIWVTRSRIDWEYIKVESAPRFGFEIYYGVQQGKAEYLGYSGKIMEQTYISVVYPMYVLPSLYKKGNYSEPLTDWDTFNLDIRESAGKAYGQPAFYAAEIKSYYGKKEKFYDFPQHEWFVETFLTEER